MSGSRAAAAGRRPHPAVVARRRRIARAQGRQRRLAALIGAAALAALGLLWWLAHGPLLAVNGVTVRGYDREDRAALTAAISEAASGGTMASPPVDEIRSAAAAFPWVAAVSVQRDWPRRVTVDVTMARPAGVAAGPGGEAALVSEAGRVLGPVPDRAGLGWLRLPAAPPAAGYALGESDRAGLTFLAAAPPAAARRVRRLALDSTGALSARIDGGPVLRLGRPEDLAAKARALAVVLAQVPPADLAAATYIDLRVPVRPAIGGLPPAVPEESPTTVE
ncbi:MAG TPA: cell division protein FtsQ/DivIB [Miltoncostaeaceae bacterium]|nr:cell division protein FtsQ/DivIB [Miltoncostaeaceae bacterium]